MVMEVRNILEIKQLAVAVEGKEILRDMNLTIRNGEAHKLVDALGAKQLLDPNDVEGNIFETQKSHDALQKKIDENEDDPNHEDFVQRFSARGCQFSSITRALLAEEGYSLDGIN